MRCWNCGIEVEEGRYCARCGQPLRPNLVEARQARDRIEYLLDELSRWTVLSEDVRDQLTGLYRERQVRLQALAAPREVPVARRVHIETPPGAGRTAVASPPASEAAPPSEPPGKDWVGALSGFFEERNIRWFHSLGALLLLSAGIGYLRATWSGPGRQIVALLLVGSPALCFWWAHRLKERLPLSSRLLSVLGGLLLPTGLLALNHLHVLGLNLPPDPYNAFAMLVTAAVLLHQARQLQEVASLYLGTAALGLSGVWLSSAAGTPLPLGLVALFGAFAYLMASRRTQPGESPPERLGRHLVVLSQLQGLLAMLSTAGELTGPSWSPLIPFFLSALFFAGTAHLLQDARALVVSATAALGAGWILTRALDLSPLALGYSALFIGAVYLAAGRLFQDPALSRLSRALGTAVTSLVLLGLLGGQLLTGMWDNFAAQSRSDLATAALISLLAAFFFAASARLERAPSALYGSALCLGYGYFAAVVFVHRASPHLYPLFLSALPCLLVGGALLLRRLLPAAILTPFVHLGTVLAALSGPLAFGLELAGVPGSAGVAPWVFAATGATFLMTALWASRPEPLYLSFSCLAMAYARWTGALLPNLGLAFLPLVLLVALIALRAARSWGTEYGLALGRVALAAGVFFSGSQLFDVIRWQLKLGYATPFEAQSAAQALLAYAGLFAWGAQAFAGWGAQRWLAVLACAGAPSSLLAWPGGFSGKLGMMAVGAAGMLAARALPENHPWRQALTFTPLATSSWMAFVGYPRQEVVVLAYGPAFLWLLASIPRIGPRVAFGLCLLGPWNLVGGFHTPEEIQMQAGLAGLAAAWFAVLAVRRGQAELPVYGWVLGGLAWLVLGLEHRTSVVSWWWPFSALVLTLWLLARRGRPELADSLKACTLATAGGVVLVSLGAPAPGLTSLSYAAALLVVGWLLRDRSTFAMGSLLLQLGSFQVGGRWFPALAALWGGVSLAVEAAGPEELRGWSPSYSAASAWLATVGGVVTGAWNLRPAVLGLGAAALLWQARAARGLGARNHAWGFAAGYLAWWFLLDELDVSILELTILPAAAWALFWSHRWHGQGNSSAAGQAGLAGAALLLGPPILATTGAGSAGHALFAGAAATALLVWGVGVRRPGLAVWGSLGLACEMVVQLFHLSVVLPWQLTAAGLGILLVGLGVLFERKRTELLQATRRVLKGLP